MAPAIPATARKALPTVICTVVVIAAALWQHETVAAGMRALLAADPGWLAIALIATLGLWPTSVWMLRGSIPAQPSSARLFALQLAVPAIGLIPAASLLIRLRFLRREGLSHSAAVASMTLFGFAALVVRIPLVIIAILATPSLIDRTNGQPPWHDLGPRLSAWWQQATANSWHAAGIVATVVLIGGALIAAATIVLRRWIAGRGGWHGLVHHARAGRTDAEFAWKSVAATALRPGRAALLWVCALAQPLLMVVALWAVLHAVGAGLSLADTFVVQLVTVALAPLMPSPSGVASKEITLAAGLTALAGLTGGVAVGAALGFRLLTFWFQIPLGLGSFAYLNHRRAI